MGHNRGKTAYSESINTSVIELKDWYFLMTLSLVINGGQHISLGQSIVQCSGVGTRWLTVQSGSCHCSQHLRMVFHSPMCQRTVDASILKERPFPLSRAGHLITPFTIWKIKHPQNVELTGLMVSSDGPVMKKPQGYLANAGYTGLDLSSGKIPHASGKLTCAPQLLSPHA